MEVSLTLPCYNEESNIREVATKACEYLNLFTDRYEVIVVDDGSIDKSLSIINELINENPNIRVIHHDINQGYGSAVSDGLRDSRYKYVCFVDSDGQFDFKELKQLIELMPGNDMVLGYRATRKDPIHRLINAKMYAFLLRILFGLKVKDINCAFKVFKKSLIDDIYMESEGALINAEILIKAKQRGYTKIREIPVSHYPRISGKQTGANIKVILRAFAELFRLKMKIR
ncbi:MAG: glycosyltransferase family 2 protein [bacterium]